MSSKRVKYQVVGSVKRGYAVVQAGGGIEYDLIDRKEGAEEEVR